MNDPCKYSVFYWWHPLPDMMMAPSGLGGKQQRLFRDILVWELKIITDIHDIAEENQQEQ